MNTVIVSTAADAAEMFLAELPKEQSEERVFVLPLDANGAALSKPILVSVGHEDATVPVNVGLIFRKALMADAEELIVAHNHPSGSLKPSAADLEATAKMREAAVLLGVRFLDHLIIGCGGFASLAEMA